MYAGLGALPAVIPAVTGVVTTVKSIFGGIFGGGVSAAERATHMANLQTLYNQALGGDAVALCRLQAAGGVGIQNGDCGGTRYGTFSDTALKAEAARLYYQATGSGVRPPSGGLPGIGGMGTGTLLAVGAGAVLLLTLARRRR